MSRERGMFLNYTIGEFSRETGLSIYTLRYYEQEGLIIPERSQTNRRSYTENDAAWVAFIMRLKATGMPIKEIREYAKLRSEGDGTLARRLEMLVQHRQTIEEQIKQLQEHEVRLDEKISFYRQEIERINKH